MTVETMFRPKGGLNSDNDEMLLTEQDRRGHSVSLGKPRASTLCSWKDYLAILGCLTAFTVAAVIVYMPRYAVYWGQTRQFIWVGLCLTLMAWCTQLPLRRLFLVTSTNTQASTLQSMDAILRSDPTADRADWRIRIILAVMLGLSPALSAAYKSLGGGESRYTRQDVAAQIGMTGPPGTQNLGYGLSQFINATLPWYKDPGFPDRVYGFNLHVVNENTSAMLDGPMPAYVEDIQAALRIEQSKRITADVAAIVCERTDHFVGDDDYYDELFNPDNTLSTGDMWVRESDWHVAMVFPNSSDNTNIIVGNYNSTINEKFSSHLKQYTLSKRNYTGSWHITKNSVELTYAGPKAGILDERGLLSNNFRSFTDLYKVVFAEYDWRYLSAARSPATNTDDGDKYTKFIKSDSTFLAAMVWSRLVAVDGPEVWSPGTSSGIYGDDGWPELRYNTTVAEATISTTIKPSWGIGIVLGINPALLLFALLCRVLFWSRSPIGDKFGLVSILASVEQQSLGLLQGAGLSGRLKRLVFAGFRPETQGNREESWGSGNIVTVLGTKQLRSGAIQKGTTYS